MPLPKVEIDGEPPYVCATTYPNGPTGIATEGRVSIDDLWFHPRAKVSVKIKDASQPIGIAGHYQQLVFEFAGNIEHLSHVWAQDLLADEAIDIKQDVRIDGSTMVIDGALIQRIGTSASNPGDTSAPGLVIQLEGDSLPYADATFTPHVTPVKQSATPNKQIAKQSDGYFGTAEISRSPYGYRVEASGPSQFVLKELPRGVTNGKILVAWKMKSGNGSATKNGLIVLSSDEDAKAAVCAGSWIGANEITLFENDSSWGNDLKKPIKQDRELDCRLEVDLDQRTASFTVNGETLQMPFSESLTSIHYVGFGVHRSQTLFSEPVIKY
ncbi:hypothetical protein RMSM_04722 [Rhodopirellula maiorica SM1]|uniref:Uncharacterized protein n=2 Tax=Novipirellula TaxID=2795426 RepID=M5RGA9_9BACT|nr:hypothetical protein RMSM_04722 [Rhodopirellula maiorica SM1]